MLKNYIILYMYNLQSCFKLVFGVSLLTLCYLVVFCFFFYFQTVVVVVLTLCSLYVFCFAVCALDYNSKDHQRCL